MRRQIDRDRAMRAAEMVELVVPGMAVGARAVEQDDFAAARKIRAPRRAAWFAPHSSSRWRIPALPRTWSASF